MKRQELIQDEALRRQEFPVTGRQVFLAHAAVCPLPRRVSASVNDYAENAMHGDQEAMLPLARLGRVRESVAEFIGAEAEEVALVGPTSLALSFVAAGLPWKEGDNVVVYFDDYPSNVYPWLKLREKGVEVRLVRTPELGRIEPEQVTALLDSRTRLVALASCHFIGGYRIDLDAIGRILRERGVLFCVDGIQTLGAFPTSIRHVDFMAADGHKWLLSPCGAGFFYVRREVQEQLAPIVYGWHNVLCPDFIAQEQLILRDDARRYEAGSQNILGMVGLQAAIELIREVGVEEIARDLQSMRAWLVEGIGDKGYSILHPSLEELHCGGILSFSGPADLPELQRKLAAEGIVVSLRTDRSRRHCIRLSPHFYNTQSELQHFLDVLPSV